MNKTLWELLWDYDPNGLLVVDAGMVIRTVNPALCAMLKTDSSDLIGRHAGDYIEDLSDFQRVWRKKRPMAATEREYPKFGLFVRQVMFPIEDEGIVACIMVDLTHESQERNELQAMKLQMLENVTRVVDKQMSVAQEIAGLLGETTAETSASLRKVIDLLNEETV
ncbi:MAG: PAS domain-containing protein [Armatimonadetes bacterium]|nr:PAS domain-containing protein [Armatimonadota bacterium]